MGEAQKQCNKCTSLASLSGKDADEQKRYLGKSIMANHWKYIRSLQPLPNHRDFEIKYFFMVKDFCIPLKKFYHDCKCFLAISMWSFDIYILHT